MIVAVHYDTKESSRLLQLVIIATEEPAGASVIYSSANYCCVRLENGGLSSSSVGLHLAQTYDALGIIFIQLAPLPAGSSSEASHVADGSPQDHLVPTWPPLRPSPPSHRRVPV